jgi:hypothetical protein
MGSTKTRALILRVSREVVAEWESDPGLQEALRELRPGFAQTMDRLTAGVFEAGNRARLREEGFETARVTGAHTSEIDSAEFVR